MDHVVTIFDNTLEYIPADKGLNYIVCEGYSEVFFGVYQITVNGSKFIGEGVDTIKGLPVVKLPIIIDGVEHDALFALKSDPSQTGVVINVNSLSNGREVILDEKQAVEEIAKEVEITPIDEVFEETTNVSESIKIDIERYKQDALRVISENFKDKKVKLENLQEALKDFISENVNNVKQSTLVNLEEFKTDVIRTVETIVETNKVDTDSSIAEINALKENISALVNGYVTDLEFTSSEKVAALEELQEKVSFEIDSKLHDLESQANNYKQVAEEEYKKLETFVIDSEKSLTEQNQSNAETIRKLIESVGEKSEEIDRLVESKIKIFRSLATEETATITTLIGNKLLEFDSKIESVGQGLIEAVEAKVKNANLVAIKKEDLSSLKKQLEDKINTESANLKKYVAGYGGGGSVAVQYADGGIMNGTLNIASGQILSGGVDLYDIFSSGGGGFQTLSFNESDATLTITPNGNTISLSALSGGGGGSATGAYLPLSGGTVTGTTVFTGTLSATLIEAVSANFTVIDIKQYELSGFNVEGNVTVSGTISSNNIVYANGGNSNNWNSAYTTLNANSGSWDSVYSTVNTYSATDWNYQGSDIKALTANWENTYTDFSGQSSSNVSVYSTVNSKSASWDSVYSSFNAQSGANASVYSSVNSNSASWDSVYSTVNSNSATQWNYQGSDIKSLTANWQNTYTDFSGQSSNNAAVYSTVNSNSASWDSVYSGFNTQSAANAAVYSTVNSNSATQWNYQGSDIKALTANWENTYSTVNTTSATWLQTLAFDEVTSILSISDSNSVSLSALNESSVFSNYLPLSGGTLTGTVSTNQDIEITDSTKGIILRSPSNFKYRITVTDAGELVTTAI